MSFSINTSNDEEMDKISIYEFEKIMGFDVEKNNEVIEIHFCIEDSQHYTSCWAGKLISKNRKEIYWLGLTDDGMEAYDFESVEQLLEAKVFNGECFKDIWDKVIIISIDSCEPRDRLKYYQEGN